MNLAELDGRYLMSMDDQKLRVNPLPGKQFRVPLLCLRIGCDKRVV